MNGMGQEMVWMEEQRDASQITTGIVLLKSTSRKDSIEVFETDIVLPPSQRPKKKSIVPNEESPIHQTQPFPYHFDSTLMDDMTMAAQDAFRPFQHHAEEARRNLERMIPNFLINAISTEEEDEKELITENIIQNDNNNVNTVSMDENDSHTHDTENDDDSESTVSVNTWRHAEISRVVVDQQQLPAFFPTSQQNSPVMALSATISTLGFDNTFMSPTGTTIRPSKSPRAPQDNVMSVSSLNDFMDGDDERHDDADHNAILQKKRQTANKTVPAVIASKPMHETTKNQKSSGVGNIMDQTASPKKSAEKGSSIVMNVLTTTIQPAESVKVPVWKCENGVPSPLNEIAQPKIGEYTRGGPTSPNVVAVSPGPMRSLLSCQSMEEIVTHGEVGKQPPRCKSEDLVAVADLRKGTGKKNRFRFFHKIRGKQEEVRVVQKNVTPAVVPLESVTVLSTCQVSALTVKSAPPAILRKELSERSLSGLMDIPPIYSDDSRLKPEMGDKYTAFADQTDHVTDEARKRLDNKAPIVSDVDMMLTMTPKIPSVIRNVFSADAADGISFNGIATFGKVEVGDDDNTHTQGTILNRDSVAKAMNSPWNAAVPTPAVPLKRTVRSHDCGLASDTFMEELEVHMSNESETLAANLQRVSGSPKSSNTPVAQLSSKARDLMPMKVDEQNVWKLPRTKKRFQPVRRSKETSVARELQPIQLRRTTAEASTCAAVSSDLGKSFPKSEIRKNRFCFMKRMSLTMKPESWTPSPTQENEAPFGLHRIDL